MSEPSLPETNYLDDDKPRPVFRSESWWLIYALGALFFLHYLQLGQLQNEHDKASQVLQSLEPRIQEARQTKQQLEELALGILKYAPSDDFAKQVVDEFMIRSLELPPGQPPSP